MNIPELGEILRCNHIPDGYYRLPGMLGNDDCEALECEDGVWSISYYERGMPSSGKSFATEEEGCAALWEMMKQRATWPVSLEAPPLTEAMAAFSEYFERHGEIFTTRGLSSLWFKGFQVRNGYRIALLENVPYQFYYTNWTLKVHCYLSFADLNGEKNGISVLLSNRSQKEIQVRDLLAARGFTTDAALFDYPQPGLACEDQLDRVAGALERAFDGVLKPVLEGASLSSSEPPTGA